MAEPIVEGGPRTISDLLGVTTRYLELKGTDTARLDAEVLLGDTLGMGRLELYLHHDRPLEPQELAAYRERVRRRAALEPIAYILGTKGFRSIDLDVDARVLVPRPETEVLVEVALARLPQGGALLDLGTGSGAIALAAATERPDARVVAVDASADAVAVACQNRDRLGLDAVRIVVSDLDAALAPDERFDVIAANLPYVPAGDPALEERVRRHEPHAALFGGADGLDVIRRAIAGAPARLAPGGSVVLEVGEGQAEAVGALLAAAGLADVAVERDLAGIARVVAGRRPAG